LSQATATATTTTATTRGIVRGEDCSDFLGWKFQIGGQAAQALSSLWRGKAKTTTSQFFMSLSLAIRLVVINVAPSDAKWS
jgi:hypothetical protein